MNHMGMLNNTPQNKPTKKRVPYIGHPSFGYVFILVLTKKWTPMHVNVLFFFLLYAELVFYEPKKFLDRCLNNI
ncbi:hypothetical protein BleG1_3085 [Shouchella lehensis G1]|uniref:Uncharacterized protein n=2 Tax=Bacillaceae TaxID=186817 RepID=A0A060M6D9_9BACI|nr:hypothetical protein BleG1_3085 [Shouchella lehensis G1]KQL57057.1 hypothetical protein AN965_10290 [Alkalicoccobacillus plakortidis]